MRILGISAFYHDAAATITIDGKIIAAAQEERFTRKKHDPSFPSNAIRYCLEYSGLTIDDLDAIAFYDKPLLKFERLLETYYAFAPKGLRSFLLSMPVWLREKIFLKRLIYNALKEIHPYDKKKIKLLFPEHHLSHAASAFYPSKFNDAAILTIDGVGEWATASICHGKGNTITILKELQFPHSVGLLYSSFTYYLGFRVNSGEYKLMGLAPYGNINDPETKQYVESIKKELIEIKDDGSIWLNQQYFNYATGTRMVNERHWHRLFGFPSRKSESDILQHHCNLALAIQQVTEEIVLLMAANAKELTGSENLCLAGGVALNCVANGQLLRRKLFKEIYIQPAAGDAGGSLGAALAAHYIYFEQSREADEKQDTMQGAFLGPSFNNLLVESMAGKYNAPVKKIEEDEILFNKVAELLDQGKVVGWFQGRMEFGPRALGNRSILGDARNPDMQKKLNLKIKYRESFRPFAPSVLSEDTQAYFDLDSDSPYMLLVAEVQVDRRKPMPDNYDELPLKEKLYHLRSDIPAITHLDFSARVQTVHKETNPRFHSLLYAFKQKTGYGLLVNTSFNVRGEPIVCTPNDAYRCLMRTEMDHLVVGNYLFNKDEQPEWHEADDWRELLEMD